MLRLSIPASPARNQSGFTLVELAIVLVIIGLIIGGVLVGRDLIEAAEINAQILQIGRFNTAMHAFQTKYDCLPGDCADAAKYGFTARGTNAGQGDGDGVLEGNNTVTNTPTVQTGGETALFWSDLSRAGLIEGNFSVATAVPVNGTAKQYFPIAKLGRGNFIYVYSGGAAGGDGINYFGISAITSFYAGEYPLSSPALTVQQSYSIDLKVDDGFPQSGVVRALYMNFGPPWIPPTSVHWASGSSGVDGANSGGANGPTTAATLGTATTCYDNGNVNGGQQKYSTSQNKGLLNCALSFKFQ